MNINMRKIKNYIVLVLFVIGSIITLWNQLTGDQDKPQSEELVLVEESQTTQELSQDESSQSISLETSQEQTQEQTQENNYADALYNEALESIQGYRDVVALVWLSDVDNHVKKSYNLYKDEGWNGLVPGQADGTKAGGRWGNYDDQLPEYTPSGTEITYKEFDVNDKIEGRSRDAQRFVVGSDRSVYYTDDHYDSFVKIIE